MSSGTSVDYTKVQNIHSSEYIPLGVRVMESNQVIVIEDRRM